MPVIGLGIDTTFDDTSLALVLDKRQILANVTLSQFKDHEEFGGVVPERACRKHLEVIHPLLDEALKQAQIRLEQIDYIAVSHYPGLLGAILVGLTVAKSLSYALQRPLIGVNHVEAHPYANFLVYEEIQFPVLHLVVAGGHTLLFHARNHFDYTIVGRSYDDAAGECVDKVAKMFGHAMPGGPVVDRYALEFPGDAYEFPRPLFHEDHYHFSFSGLKTAMLRFRANHPEALHSEGPILSSFFQSVVDVLLHKTFKAARELGLRHLSVSGGLAASKKLRQSFEAGAAKRGLTLYYPPPRLCTDNAAMVACLGGFKHATGQHDDLSLEAFANIS